jgi:hypothetical protein
VKQEKDGNRKVETGRDGGETEKVEVGKGETGRWNRKDEQN